jgi:teichuronic acid biosynthesis glycosyltransferase TuaH
MNRAQRTSNGAMTAPERLVVFCAGTPWDGVRGSDQQLALHLAGHCPVLYVDPPLSVRAAWARRGERPVSGLRPVAPNLHRLTVLTPPGPNRPLVRPVAMALTRFAVQRAVRRMGMAVRATIVASLDDLFRRAGGTKVLYVTDDFVAGASLMGLDPSHVAAWERERAAEADLVVAVSPVLVARWEGLHRRVALVPNGCDADGLLAVDEAPLPAGVDLAPPIAGFIGNISERIDLTWLRAVADAGLSLLVVGPAAPGYDAELEATLGAPNVARVGLVPYESVPGYLRMIDVGLVPYVDDDFNQASFPLKALELLAAGRPVVSTDLPSIRWLASPDIDLASTPEAFVAAVQRRLGEDRSPEAVARRQALAMLHSWAARAEQLLSLL